MVVRLEAVFAPLHLAAAAATATAADQQRYLVFLGMFLQDAQVELHQVPTDDGVGIMPLQPLENMAVMTTTPGVRNAM